MIIRALISKTSLVSFMTVVKLRVTTQIKSPDLFFRLFRDAYFILCNFSSNFPTFGLLELNNINLFAGSKQF